MYKNDRKSFNSNKVTSSGTSSRFSGGRSRFGGSGRPSSNRGGTRTSSNRSGRNGGFSQNINVSKFISKAAPIEKTVEFKPINSFADFKIDKSIKTNITNKGYTSPTPIQDQIIPHILNGADVVGIANTGTGKTGAFLIPLVQKVLHNYKERVIIIVPTRELAVQINQELRTLVTGMNLYSTCCVGGASIGGQIAELKQRYNNFIIGTPGRLKDLIERKMIDLSKFATIVLDEADRMLDMGFIGDMKFVMAKMPKERHTLFFSATMSDDIKKLINEFLKNPITVSVKTGDTSKNIDQDIVKNMGKDKIDVLHNLLIATEFTKVLIFGKTKHGVERLSKTLKDRGFKAESIHGNKNHSQRQRALGLFKEERVQILVATDVAARGLDIPDVSHVINYDIPATYDDYVHRIGRTGRGNKTGKALTFVD
ncbi:MAG: DEAD/DEAH box helicase [bacterium]